MVKPLIILIPPSEGKASGGSCRPLIKVSPQLKIMLDRFLNFKGDQEKLLGVKGQALKDAVECNKNILSSPTLPAIERYTGVVYQGIKYPLLSISAKNFLNEHVRIVSALFGLLAPQDLIPEYKLKIEKLDAQKYWKPLIAERLKSCFVIDLLPQAHQKAVDYKDGVAVDFIVQKNGKRIPAGHNGKLIKGKFVRWLCENKISGPDDFVRFVEDGFKWNGLEFTKKLNG